MAYSADHLQQIWEDPSYAMAAAGHFFLLPTPTPEEEARRGGEALAGLAESIHRGLRAICGGRRGETRLEVQKGGEVTTGVGRAAEEGWSDQRRVRGPKNLRGVTRQGSREAAGGSSRDEAAGRTGRARGARGQGRQSQLPFVRTNLAMGMRSGRGVVRAQGALRGQQGAVQAKALRSRGSRVN